MSKDIKVILDTGPSTDVDSLSTEELEVLFEQVLSEIPNLTAVTIDSFISMITESSQEKVQWIKPSIIELLLRKIIQLSHRTNSLNVLVIPVIMHNSIVKSAIYGSAQNVPRMRKMAQQPMPFERKSGSIYIRFDKRTRAVTDRGLEYIVPPNEEIGVIGIIFNKICTIPQIIKYDRIGDSGKQLVNMSTRSSKSIEPLLPMGSYDDVDAARTCDLFKRYPSESSQIYMFDKSTDIISDVFDYLHMVYFSVLTPGHATSIYGQIERAVTSVESGKKSKKSSLQSGLLRAFSILKPRDVAGEIMSPPKLPTILIRLEALHNGKFALTFNGALMADIVDRGLSSAYFSSIIHGPDAKKTVAHLDAYKTAQANVEFNRKLEQKRMDNEARVNTYVMIVEKKFGAPRAAELERMLKLHPLQADKMLSLLKPHEKKAVETEYQRRLKYTEARLNNKCEHVQLYQRFRYARDSARKQQFYKRLKWFFKNPKTTKEMIICNVCGFEIICPHVKELAEFEFNNARHDVILSRLISAYADRSSGRGDYYCKICGESFALLSTFDDADLNVNMALTMDEELKNFIWVEVAHLMKYLQFGKLIDVQKLITAARDAIYPYIFEIEKQILKSKTNTVDEIKAKKRLFVTIYGFAFLIHLILSNAKLKNIVSFKDFQTKPKTAIVDMIKHVIKIIMISRNVLIKDIPGMSADVIKNKLIEAYKTLQNQGKQVIKYSTETPDVLTTLMVDPVYKYIYNITVLDDAVRGRKIKKFDDTVERVDSIMGKQISKLGKDVFADVNIPTLRNGWDKAPFDNIVDITGANIYVAQIKQGKNDKNGKISKYPTRTVYSAALPGYVARSFEHFSQMLVDRVFAEPKYMDVSVGKGIEVRLRKPHEEARERYLDLAEKERLLFKYRKMEFAKNYVTVTGGSRKYVDPNSHIGRIYDESGRPHRWNIYVVDGKKEKSELKLSDITNIIEGGKRFVDKVIDKKCSICGVLWSQAHTLNANKIKSAIRSKFAVDNFFRFYENRCPKGSLHEFGDSSLCKKCGFTGAKDNLEYYKKYKKEYDLERADMFTRKTSITAPVGPPDTTEYEKEYENWVPNFNIILDLANKLKINHRLLVALGAIERIEYNDVLSGDFIAPEAEERNDTRIYMLTSYVINLLVEWNQLRFFNRVIKPPADLTAVVENSGVSRHKIGEIGAKLPTIMNDFNIRLAAIKRIKKPRDIVLFCIQTFCEICLEIWTDTNQQTEKLRRTFVEYIVKKLLRAEQLTTKPGYFNWSLLYGEKETKEKTTYDSNYDKDLHLRDNRGINVEAPEETDAAPMSMDAFDVEVDPDAPPDDDDSNQINVSGYGLD